MAHMVRAVPNAAFAVPRYVVQRGSSRGTSYSVTMTLVDFPLGRGMVKNGVSGELGPRTRAIHFTNCSSCAV